MVEPIKSRDVSIKTIPGGSTLAMCTHFPPKLLHGITFGDVLTLLAILFSLVL